jgi:hypothetical protein
MSAGVGGPLRGGEGCGTAATVSLTNETAHRVFTERKRMRRCTCAVCKFSWLDEANCCAECGSESFAVEIALVGAEIHVKAATGQVGTVVDETATSTRPHVVRSQTPLGAKSSSTFEQNGTFRLEVSEPDVGRPSESLVMQTLVEHLRDRGVDCQVAPRQPEWDREGIDSKLELRGDGRTLSSIAVQITAVPQVPTFWAAARHASGITDGDFGDLVSMALSAIEAKSVRSPAGSVLVIDARHAAPLVETLVVTTLTERLHGLRHPFVGIVLAGPTAAMTAILIWNVCPLI